MIEHCQEQCLPDHEHTVQTQLDSFSRSETLCTTGEAKERQSASGLHTCLQHESLWLAHRTTTVKCSKGHVRDATASEQLPLGHMLGALCAPPVPPGRDMQASEDLFMDLDEQPSKRPRDTPSSSTQQFEFANPDEFLQRARNVSVPLPRTLSCASSGDTFSARATWKRCTRNTTVVGSPTPPFHCFPGGETAPVTTRVENSNIAQPAPSFSVPVSRPMPSTFAVPSTLPADSVVSTEVPSTLLPDLVVAHSHADPVVAHDHVPTQFDEESAVDTQVR